MDGNGRWAKRRGLPRSAGHKAGAETLIKIAEACQDIGIKYLTVYAFSTENWQRPQDEVNYLMDLFREYFKKIRNDKRTKGRIKIIGDIKKLPEDLQEEVKLTEKMTQNNEGIQLNIALNYGGRDEIHNAVKNMFKDYKNGVIDEKYIEE
jgi:undecaprenyl diphosphate synthase